MSARTASAAVRVLLVASNFPPLRGGSGAVYAALARHAGGAVAVLAPEVAYPDGLPIIGWREHDRLAPFPVRRIPLLRNVIRPRGGAWRTAWLRGDDLMVRARLLWTVLRLCRELRCETVCVGELVAGAWLLRTLRLVPWLRTAVYVHGEELTTLDGYDDDFRRRLGGLASADTIFAVSGFTRAVLRERLPARLRDRVVLIANGVDRDRFRPGVRDPWLVDRYGLAGRFVFVTVCRLLEKKGVDVAIRAFADIHRDDPAARFLVVGDGPYAATLRDLAASLGLGGAVVFAGSVEEAELAAHYRLGDVFVMPNRRLDDGDTEGFGLVFLEANACGLAVVAGRDGGTADAVADGDNGLVVDGRSMAAVAAAMRALKDDPALRDRLAAGGLARAAEAGWEARAALFLDGCARGAAARRGAITPP